MQVTLAVGLVKTNSVTTGSVTEPCVHSRKAPSSYWTRQLSPSHRSELREANGPTEEHSDREAILVDV